MRKAMKNILCSVAFIAAIAGGAISASAKKPVITGATEKTMDVGTTFNPMSKVTAKDGKGKNITKKIRVTGKVNTNKKGVYVLAYTVTSSKKEKATVKRTVVIKEKNITFTKPNKQFDVVGGFGNVSMLDSDENITITEIAKNGWMKTTKGKWVKKGFVGDYVYIGKKMKLYASSTSTKAEKNARFRTYKVLARANNKRVEIEDGWIENPSFIEDYDTQNKMNEAKEILRIINVERKKVNAQPLVMDTSLNRIATIRSIDMIDYKYFSHTSPNYGSFSTLVKGINYGYWMLGENIAAGGYSASDYMRMWMNSEGHKENILNKSYERVGISFVKNEKSGFYSSVATQVFARKR